MANTTFAIPVWQPLYDWDDSEGHSHHAEPLPWVWSLIFALCLPWLMVTRKCVIVERSWCELFLIRMERERRYWRVSGTWRGQTFEVGADTPMAVVSEMSRLRRMVARDRIEDAGDVKLLGVVG